MTQDYIYTTYIKSSPEKIWEAIINPEFTRQYWMGGIVSDWKAGSKWSRTMDDGKLHLSGDILEATPPKRLVLTWVENGHAPSQAHPSRVTFEIEPLEDVVKLTVTHNELDPDMAKRVSMGWPRVLSSMKSLLETGAPLSMAVMKKDCGRAA